MQTVLILYIFVFSWALFKQAIYFPYCPISTNDDIQVAKSTVVPQSL